MNDYKNEFFPRPQEDKRPTILPLTAWAVVIGLVLGGALYSAKVHAEAMFTTSDGTVAITLYSDPCELKGEIKNLPYKAVWTEAGKTFEGCWLPRDDVRLVTAYFADKTVALIPYSVFKKAVGV